MSTPELTVNGRTLSFDGVPPHTTALDWLRDQGLTGSKEGCAEGECGACAIMVARPAPADEGTTEWVSLNACLIPVAGLDGQEVVTAEGLGTPTALHPVQHEMAVRGGSQCGYCTPGFVCSMAAEYYRPGRSQPTAGRGGSANSGRSQPTAGRGGSANSGRSQPTAGRGGSANSDRSQPAGSGNGNGNAAAANGHDPNGPGAEADAEHGPNGFDLHALSGNLCRCTGYRPIRDAAFALGEPADDAFARRRAEAPPVARPTRLVSDTAEFVRPADLADTLALLAQRPEALLVAGSTDWGVEVNLRGARAPLVVAVDRLPELRGLSVGPDEIRIGAALTLTEIERRLAGQVPLLAEVFPQFASRLIRNSATLGGNLGTGSPIGDTTPALLALEAQLVLASASGERVVPLVDYFTGYRQSVRASDELIREIRIPGPLAGLSAFHKIAKRRFDDISSVAVAFAVDVTDGVVRRARIGLGGVAATPIRALATEAALVGRPWSEETVGDVSAVLAGEGTPLDDHRASASYRAAMLGQALLKLHAQNPNPQNPSPQHPIHEGVPG